MNSNNKNNRNTINIDNSNHDSSNLEGVNYSHFAGENRNNHRNYQGGQSRCNSPSLQLIVTTGSGSSSASAINSKKKELFCSSSNNNNTNDNSSNNNNNGITPAPTVAAPPSPLRHHHIPTQQLVTPSKVQLPQSHYRDRGKHPGLSSSLDYSAQQQQSKLASHQVSNSISPKMNTSPKLKDRTELLRTSEIHKTNDAAWNKKFKKLKQYKHREGHCNVPQRYIENQRLGRWVHTQRAHYRLMKEGKPSQITSQRIQALENLGFEWNVNGRSDAAWTKTLKELKQFKLREGHCCVPQQYNENKSLGMWVTNQRTQYRRFREGKPSKITGPRIKALENIGFEWSLNTPWIDQYEELKIYRCREGNCNVPQQYNKNKSLGIWVSNQRQQYRFFREGKQSQITGPRIQALEAIGFSWTLSKNKNTSKGEMLYPDQVPSNQS